MEGLQRAFVLHSRPYSETSLILDVFSEYHGRVSIMAKGARAKRSKIKGALQLFTPLFLKWSGKGDMAILRHAEPIGLAIPLSGNSLYSALYLNEILARVLDGQMPFPDLFHHYVNAISELAQTTNPEPALRRFELALLEVLGYGVDFLHCVASGADVDDDMRYLYRQQQGFIASLMPNPQYSFSGNELKALAQRTFTNKEQLQAAKRFTRIALKPYLGSKPLKSRELFVLRTRKLTK